MLDLLINNAYLYLSNLSSLSGKERKFYDINKCELVFFFFFFSFFKLWPPALPYIDSTPPQKQKIKRKPYLMLLRDIYKVHSGFCTACCRMNFFGQPNNICFLLNVPEGVVFLLASWAKRYFPAEQCCSQPCGVTPITARNSLRHTDICVL